jgi:hypothetical protein
MPNEYSFLQAEDWAPLHKPSSNMSWMQFVRIIEEFELLIGTCNKEIN